MYWKTIGVIVLSGMIGCGQFAVAREMEDLEDGEHEEEEFEHEERIIDEKTVIEFLKKNLPEFLPRLEKAKQHEPEEYEHMLDEIRHGIRHYYHLKEIDPEVADGLVEAHRLEIKSESLAETIRMTKDDGRKTRLKSELRTMLTRICDLRLAEQKLEAKQLRKEVEEIEQLIKKREGAKNRIVERRMMQLLFEEDDDLRWF